jgi:hypothetical protein
MPRFDILKAKRDGLSDDDITAQLEEARAAGVDLYIDPTDAAAAQVVASTPAAPNTGEALGNAVAAPFRGLAAAMDFLAERGSRAAGGAIQGFTAPTEGAIPTPAEFAAPAVGYAKGLLLGQGPEASDEIRRLGWQGIPPEWQAAMNAGQSGVPVGSIAGAALSPEGLGTAASTIATLPLDVAGGGALKLARAGTKIPKVAEALDVVRRSPVVAPVARAIGRPGALLPHRIREPIRDLMRETRGQERLVESQLKDVLDEAQTAIMQVAKEKGLAPEVAEQGVRDLLEMSGRSPGVLASASPSEQAAVQALRGLSETMPELRGAAGLREARLGSHLEEAEKATHVEFSPRIPEQKAAEALGLDPGPVSYSELEARIPGIRKANRELTTSEIETAIRKATGYEGPIFRPLLEAFEIAGQGTARSVANARALGEIASRFSVPAERALPTFRPMSKLGIFEGFADEAKVGFSNAYVDPELYGYLQDFVRETAPQKIRVMSGFLKVWKPAVTTVNPQFVSRNMQWNAIIGWIRGNRNPANWTDAASVLGRADGPPIAGLGARAALREEMIGQKVIGTGTGLEFGVHAGRRLGAGSVPRRALAAASQVNQAGEDLSRAAHYIAMRRNGMSAQEAAAEVARTYFDYTKDAFTQFENKLRENLIPFYAWTRNILPLTFRTLVEKPSGFAGLGALSRESARTAGLPLEDRPYMGAESRDVLGVTLAPYPGEEGFRTSPMSQVGFFDPGRFAASPGGAAVQQITPLVSVPAQVAGIIKNPLTGKEAEDIVALPPAAALIPTINPELAAKWGITLAAPGRAVGPERVNALFRTGGPLGTALLDLVNTGDPDAQMRAYSWLSGIRVRKEVEPQVGRVIQQRRERSEKREERYRTGQRQRLSGQIEAGER